MCTLYVFIDASNDAYEEGEGDYEEEEEEEEHFDNCTNQGKLIPCRLLPMQAILMPVILVQTSKSLPLQVIYLGHLTYPTLLPGKLLSKSYVYS